MKKGAEKVDLSLPSYIIGIVSIILAFIQPIIGVIMGIVGIVMAKNNGGDYSTRASKLNIWGIILSIIFLILYILLAMYLPDFLGLSQGGAFPVQ